MTAALATGLGTVEQVAKTNYFTQAELAAGAAAALQTMWGLLDPADIAGSWGTLRMAERLYVAVSAYQVAAVQVAPRYSAAALLAQGAQSSPHGTLVPKAFAGIASDGRALDRLVLQPLVSTLGQLRQGVSPQLALGIGAAALATIAITQIADAGRAAEAVSMAVEPDVKGYVRMLVPPSCGRCAVLAGRFYRYSTGFQRHPRCDCRMVPVAEDAAKDLRTDPELYFRSLSKQDQDRYFTAAGAESIRSGADIGQVVNARRGAYGLSQPGRLTEDEQRMLRGGRDRGRLDRVDVYGRQVYITTEGTTRRGIAGKKLGAWSADAIKDRPGRSPRRARTPRLMPESVLELAAGDRSEAVRLLERFGYITTT